MPTPNIASCAPLAEQLRASRGNAAEIDLEKARAALEEKLRVLTEVETLLTEESESVPAPGAGLWSDGPAMPTRAEAAIMAGLILAHYETSVVVSWCSAANK